MKSHLCQTIRTKISNAEVYKKTKIVKKKCYRYLFISTSTV